MLKKNIPDLRFQGYEDEWEERKLNEIADEFCGGGTPNTKVAEYWNGNIPWLQSSDLTKDEITIATANKFISTEGLSNSATKLIPANSIAIVTRVGVGKLAIIDMDYTTSQDFLSLSSLRGDTKYIAYSLYNLLQAEVKQLQGTSIKGITKEELLKKALSFPALSEQVKIGQLFTSLDKLIQRHSDKLAILKEEKATFLRKMFPAQGEKVPEMRLQGFDGEWEERKASQIFKTVSDKNHPELPVLSASQELGMIRRDEIGIDIKYDKIALTTYKRVRAGQFVIHLRSFQGGFAWSEIEGITSPAYTILDFTDKKQSSSFWRVVLTSQSFIKRLETVTYGIRDGKSISFADFSTLKFSLPSLPEQIAIGNFFQTLDQEIEQVGKKIEELKELKRTLLKRMFV